MIGFPYYPATNRCAKVIAQHASGKARRVARGEWRSGRLQLQAESDYTPRPGCNPVEPAWKSFADLKEAVHPRQPTARGEAGGGPA